MRRTLTALIAITTFLAFNFDYATGASPIKAGASCSTLNSIITSSGTKFQCVKSGKKLIWKSLGAAKVNPAPTQSPTPVLTPSPTPTATPTSNSTPSPSPSKPASSQNFYDFFDRPCNKIGDRQTLKFWVMICREGSASDLKAGPHWAIDHMVTNTFAPIPISIPVKVGAAGITFNNLSSDTEAIYAAAFNDVQATMKRKTAASADVTVYVGPNTPNVLTSGTWEDKFKSILTLFSGFNTPKTVKVVVYNYEDRDWATAKFKSIPETPPGFEQLVNLRCPTSGACGGGNMGMSPVGNASVGRFSLDGGAGSKPAFTTGGLAFHEFTHAVQTAQFYNGDDANDPTRDFTNLVPCWLIEGQAEFSAMSIPYGNVLDYENAMKSDFKTFMTNYLKDSTPDHLDAIFQKSLPPGQCHDAVKTQAGFDNQSPYNLGYSFGLYAVQALTAVGGVESVMTLNALLAHGLSFDVAFSSVYGTDWKVASRAISEAISKQIASFVKLSDFAAGPTIDLDGTVLAN